MHAFRRKDGRAGEGAWGGVPLFSNGLVSVGKVLQEDPFSEASGQCSSSDEDAVVRISSSSSAGDVVGLVAKMRDRLPSPLPKLRPDPREIDDFENQGYLSEEVGVGGTGRDSGNESEGSGSYISAEDGWSGPEVGGEFSALMVQAQQRQDEDDQVGVLSEGVETGVDGLSEWRIAKGRKSVKGRRTCSVGVQAGLVGGTSTTGGGRFMPSAWSGCGKAADAAGARAVADIYNANPLGASGS